MAPTTSKLHQKPPGAAAQLVEVQLTPAKIQSWGGEAKTTPGDRRDGGGEAKTTPGDRRDGGGDGNGGNDDLDDEGDYLEACVELTLDANALSPPRKRRLRETLKVLAVDYKKSASDIAAAVLIFWAICATLLLVTLVITNAGALFLGHDRPLIWWHESHPLRALYLIANGFSAAEITVRAGRVKHDVSLKSAEFLLLSFAAIVVLFAAAPKVTHLRPSPTVMTKYQVANECLDVFGPASTVAPVTRNAMAEMCPMFLASDDDDSRVHSDAFFAATPAIQNASEISFADSVSALSILNEHKAVTYQAMSMSITWQDGTPWTEDERIAAQALVYPGCDYIRLLCEITYQRCTYASCALSKPDQTCRFQREVETLLACASEHAPEAGELEVKDLDVALAVIVDGRMEGKGLLEHLGHFAASQFGDAEIKYLESSIRLLRTELQNMTASSKNSRSTPGRADNSSSCPAIYRDEDDDVSRGTISSPGDLNRDGVGCNPRVREFAADTASAAVFDSSVVLLCVYATLSVFVGVAGRHAPIIVFRNRMYRNAKVVGLFMGLLSSVFLYIAGDLLALAAGDMDAQWRSTEDSAARETLQSQIVSLQAWCVVYYVCSWCSLHHAMFLLIAGIDRKDRHQTTERKDPCPRARRCCWCVRGCLCWCCCEKMEEPQRDERALRHLRTATPANVAEINSIGKCVKYTLYLRRETLSAAGKFYVAYILAREIFETSFQIVGADGSARSTDYEVALVRVAAVSLNLILLPVLALVAHQRWGEAMARGVVTFVEKLFDRAFVVIGVIFQARAGVFNPDGSFPNAGEQLMTHMPTLVPALFFICAPRSSLTALAQLKEDARTQTRTAAARTIQQWARRSRRRRQRKRSTVFEVVATHTRAELGKEVHLMGKRVQQCENLCSGRNGIRGAGCMMMIFGVWFWVFVLSKAGAQWARCENELGPMAHCLRPRIYFQSGLFWQTGCNWDLVETANCSSVGLSTIPDVPDLFASMEQLVVIDISRNPLRTVPATLDQIPNLRKLDVSNSRHFKGLPYRLCASSTALEELNLTGTVAAEELDWSGQLLTANLTSETALSNACNLQLSRTLKHLDLSRNGIRCGCRDVAWWPERDDAAGYEREVVFMRLSSNSSMLCLPSTPQCKGTCAAPCHASAIINGDGGDQKALNKLLSLDLSFNEIVLVTGGTVMQATEVVRGNAEILNSSSAGVNLTGNPIAAVELEMITDTAAEQWAYSVCDANLSVVRVFTMFLIDGYIRHGLSPHHNHCESLRKSLTTIGYASVGFRGVTSLFNGEVANLETLAFYYINLVYASDPVEPQWFSKDTPRLQTLSLITVLTRAGQFAPRNGTETSNWNLGWHSDNKSLECGVTENPVQVTLVHLHTDSCLEDIPVKCAHGSWLAPSASYVSKNGVYTYCASGNSLPYAYWRL